MEANILREVAVMRMVRHPNIVRLHGAMATKNLQCSVKGGKLLRKVQKGRLDEDIARKYFRQLISAVDYCHSRGDYHQDLKPKNLLFDEDGNLKVADFGFLYTTYGTPKSTEDKVMRELKPTYGPVG